MSRIELFSRYLEVVSQSSLPKDDTDELLLKTAALDGNAKDLSTSDFDTAERWKTMDELEALLHRRLATHLAAQFVARVKHVDPETALRKLNEVKDEKPLHVRAFEDEAFQKQGGVGVVWTATDGRHQRVVEIFKGGAEDGNTFDQELVTDPSTKEILERKVSYKDAYGHEITARITPKSSVAEIAAFLEVISAVANDVKYWGVSHSMITDESPRMRKELGEVVSREPLGIRDGKLVGPTTHGAYTLRMATDILGYSADTSMSSSRIPVQKVFEQHRMAIKVPWLNEWRRAFPYFEHKDGRDIDSYNFLLSAIALTDPKSWDDENYDGESFHQVMKGPIAALKEGPRWEAEHGNYHLPELILRYEQKQGKDPQWIKDAFVANELSTAKSSVSGIAHTTESLGVLLSVPTITWSIEDRRQIQR